MSIEMHSGRPAGAWCAAAGAAHQTAAPARPEPIQSPERPAMSNPRTPTFTARWTGSRYTVALSNGVNLGGCDLTTLARAVARQTYGDKRWRHANHAQRERWTRHEAGRIAGQCRPDRTHIV